MEAYLWKKLDNYAWFLGTMLGVSSDVSHTLRKITCDGDYEKMYWHLIKGIKDATVELDNKNKEVKENG